MRRQAHLDALRSGAMLAVALWHVTVLWFFAVPLSEATASLIEWPMTLARSLSLFFLMAGFFGAALYARWGLKRFTRDRLKRIALPLVVGLATIVPVTALLLDDMLPGTPLRAGAMHLWFLWYVVLFYAAIPLLLPSRAGAALRHWLVRLLRSPLAVLVLAAVTAAAQYVAAQIPLGEVIVETPASVAWLIPLPGLVAFYGCFFFFGALIQGSGEGSSLIGSRVWLNAAIALAALVPAVLLRFGPVWTGAGLPNQTLGGYAWTAAFSLMSWAVCFTVWGLAARWLSRDRAAVRYVADSTYWIYLMHLPLAVVLVALIAPLPLPLPVSWLLAVTLLFSILLVLYELVVRHSVLGRTLNGPRPPRGWAPPAFKRARANRVREGASG